MEQRSAASMAAQRICLSGVLLVCFGSQVLAQVDVEHRRVLTVQSGMSVYHSEEAVDGFGFFWFNENHFPWERTALRLNYAGVYLDGELSYFLPLPTVTAVGIRLGGGGYADDVHPYVQGERIVSQEFDGDSGLASVFIDHQILKIAGQLPLDVRLTYQVRHSSYRDADHTSDFVLPPDVFTHTVQGEIRLGGLEREITSRRGLVAYVSADANYRDDFRAFGPEGALFPKYSDYQHLVAKLGARIPIDQTTWFLLFTGGTGHHLDELSAYQLGGNIINADPVIYTLHGYYTKEFLVRDFGLVNFEVRQEVNKQHHVTLHLYADCAAARSVPPDDDAKRILPGVGTGVGFRSFWQTDVLLSYGYGFNAVRNGDRGGHEVAVGLERKF
ncbi:MAG TPA: hypothetical protein VL171_13235 [Verrucomicrobiae bacterium]|nr:hypothetical protein [Verrucomicrobiae bacterium]